MFDFLNKQRDIQPKSIVTIKDLPLVAKHMAEGFLQGIQSSRQRGLGIEFNQYRSYEVGDELSRIDWKLFARSDRYFVREAEKESEVDIWFLLDTSRSMLQSINLLTENDKNKKPPENCYANKLEYSKLLTASLAYLVQNQGDEFGFIGLSSEKLSFVPKGSGKKHWHKLLLTLNEIQTGQFFPPLDFLKNHLAQLQRPSMIILMSDFYQDNDEITNFLSQLNRVRSEVIALRIFSESENSLTVGEKKRNSMIRFKDIETEEEVIVSANVAKTNYTKNYKKYLQALEKKISDLGLEMFSLDIEQPMETALAHYLNKRALVR